MNYEHTRIDHNINELRRVFKYNSGKLFWAISTNKSIAVGREAGSLNSFGYRQITYSGHTYKAHRLVWSYHNGRILKGKVVDHINNNRSDNRIENLRLVTQSENCKNQRIKSNNTSGFTGVAVCTNGLQWTATVGHNKKRIYLGRFWSKKEAGEAAKQAREALGYFKNHGEAL